MGLSTKFDAIRTRLLHGSATLTMSATLSDLLAEETRLQSLIDSNDSVPHNVLVAPQSLVNTARRPLIIQKIVLKKFQQN
jgi:hypothetical protein